MIRRFTPMQSMQTIGAATPATVTSRPGYRTGTRRRAHTAGCHGMVPLRIVSERAAGYDGRGVGGDEVVPARPSVGEALAQLDAALAALANADWSAEDDRGVNDAAVAVQRRINTLQGVALRPLAIMQLRETFLLDGAATPASWLRNRINCTPATASRLCSAAARLRHLPLVREALLAGDTTLAHVTMITEAAVPNRMDAIRAVEQPLCDLAVRCRPGSLQQALRRVRDVADPDGTPSLDTEDDEPAFDAGTLDPRVFWRHRVTIDGLHTGEYCVPADTGEVIQTLMDAYSRPDPPGTPLRQCHSPAQRRVAAMRTALLALLATGQAPTVNGVKPHLLGMIDLVALMGRDNAATFTAELRRTGRVSHATIARLGIDARFTPVLTLGRYRVVGVGRTQRTLPGWLRPLLEMLLRRCRGPDCDRPACWAEAHHEIPWADGGETDLNLTIPLCPRHHRMVTNEGWTVTLDRDSGIATWTSPTGRTILTYP